MKRLHRIGDWLVAWLSRRVFGLLRLLGPDRASNLGAWVAPRIGRWLPHHRHAMANLRLAFPEKSEAERVAIARQSWENLGRTVCEYPHLGVLYDGDGKRVESQDATKAQFAQIRDAGRPVLIFGAHLANWELPAVIAHAFGQRAAILYRTPNNPFIAADIVKTRAPIMGELIPAGISAPIRMTQAVDAGINLGMLVDQRFGRGPRVPFFGHPVAANPFIARLARRFEAPVHGMRAVRLPNNRFSLEVTAPLDLPRDAAGRIDVEAATAMINRVIEDWVRENPGQWLWMHRRWRP